MEGKEVEPDGAGRKSSGAEPGREGEGSRGVRVRGEVREGERRGGVPQYHSFPKTNWKPVFSFDSSISRSLDLSFIGLTMVHTRGSGKLLYRTESTTTHTPFFTHYSTEPVTLSFRCRLQNRPFDSVRIDSRDTFSNHCTQSCSISCVQTISKRFGIWRIQGAADPDPLLTPGNHLLPQFCCTFLWDFLTGVAPLPLQIWSVRAQGETGSGRSNPFQSPPDF